jgi:hypothetical protein
MTNEKILQMIQDNQIEELKKELMQEIIIKNSNNKNKQKALLKLSQQAEKEQRDKYYKKSANGTYKYIRPALAGAWFDNGTTNICNGFWLYKSNEIINGLQMIPNTDLNLLDLNKIIPYDDIKEKNEITFNVEELMQAVKQPKEKDQTIRTIRIKENLFNANFVYDVYNCFEEPKTYMLPNMIIFKDANAIGLVLKLREI